jgi:hypothetical protein
MTDADWLTLVDALRSGRCTPFIGAGACHRSLPLGHELADELAEQWEKESRFPCPLPRDHRGLRRLDQVAQFVAVRLGSSYVQNFIARRIRAAPPPDNGDPLEPHRYFAQFNFPLYLTTNYDSFMVDALRYAGKNPQQEFARWPSHLLASVCSRYDDSSYQPTVAEPVVFHLHGCVGMEDGIGALVISEDDYLDFLVNLAKGTPVAPHPAIVPLRIERAICMNSLLFVGYSLNDVNLRVVLRGIFSKMSPSHQPKSVAVQLPPDGNPEYQGYLEQYFDRLKVMIFWGTIEEFIRALESRLAKVQVARP